jgi:MraZ protein
MTVTKSLSHRAKNSSEEGVEIESQGSFLGNHSHNLDEKGRVNLTAEFRRVLNDSKEESVVLTNYISDGSRCLEGFALSAWQEFEKKLRAKSRFDPKLQKLENYYLSRAAHCSIDGGGRILIPAYLRGYAGLEREIVFTSSIHGFRVWDSRVWDLIFSQAEEALVSNPELFAEVDL